MVERGVKGTKNHIVGLEFIFKLGFAVVNVEYRLSSQGVAPAAVEDVRCSMLYMVNHADSFNIDRNKIVFPVVLRALIWLCWQDSQQATNNSTMIVNKLTILR